MAGYLDSYGAGDDRRERRNKRIVIWGLAAVIVVTVLYFTFRDWRQEQVVKQFLTLLRQQDYQGAFKLWAPSKGYPPEMFIEDWGPSSPYGNAAGIKILHEDDCGAGVVFNLEAPNAKPIGVYVENGTNVVSFAPWPRCPGKHWQIWEFIKSRFG